MPFDRGDQGIIYRIASQLKEYLTQNEGLAKCFFNTIIELSKDKMDCYKYNVSNLNAIGKEIDYQPNMMKPPVWVKEIFREKI